MTGPEFADVFSRYANTMARDDSGAIEAMLRDHRTLQQNMMRFCIAYIEGMAQNMYDLRNEASVTLAKEIINKCPDRHLPFI